MPESQDPKPRVAVIGLGSMGFGMATSLRRAGFAVTGCDVSGDAVARFVADGGGGAKTPAAAAEKADIVVSVVVNAAQTETILFGKDGVTVVNQAYDLGLTKKYKFAGDGSISEPTNLPAQGNKIDGFIGINRYIPVFQGPLDTPYHKAWFEEAKTRLAKVDPSGPLPDKYVQSDYEAINVMKIAMERSKFQGRADTMKLIEALEGLDVKAGPDFPQGDKTIRKEDHQAFLQEFIFEVKDGTYKLMETVSKDKQLAPPACKFPAA